MLTVWARNYVDFGRCRRFDWRQRRRGNKRCRVQLLLNSEYLWAQFIAMMSFDSKTHSARAAIFFSSVASCWWPAGVRWRLTSVWIWRSGRRCTAFGPSRKPIDIRSQRGACRPNKTVPLMGRTCVLDLSAFYRLYVIRVYCFVVHGQVPSITALIK